MGLPARRESIGDDVTTPERGVTDLGAPLPIDAAFLTRLIPLGIFFVDSSFGLEADFFHLGTPKDYADALPKQVKIHGTYLAHVRNEFDLQRLEGAFKSAVSHAALKNGSRSQIEKNMRDAFFTGNPSFEKLIAWLSPESV